MFSILIEKLSKCHVFFWILKKRKMKTRLSAHMKSYRRRVDFVIFCQQRTWPKETGLWGGTSADEGASWLVSISTVTLTSVNAKAQL